LIIDGNLRAYYNLTAFGAGTAAEVHQLFWVKSKEAKDTALHPANFSSHFSKMRSLGAVEQGQNGSLICLPGNERIGVQTHVIAGV
jgi:hypothetical protein